MSMNQIERIESDIGELSLAEQLLLVERLIQNIRRNTTHHLFNSELAAMANDPEIQEELRLIEAEFAGTETDGLDKAV